MALTFLTRRKGIVQGREPFKYHQLQSKDHIRVLRVDRSKSRNGQLHCTLTQINRHQSSSSHDPVKWTAISYRWGPLNDLVPIGLLETVDSTAPSESVYQEALIPRTLESMVRQLHQYHLGPTENFWIDYLCLNQQNSEEKAEQVGMMGEIYSLSARTLAWMGDTNELNRLAFKNWLRVKSFKDKPSGTMKDALRAILSFLRLGLFRYWALQSLDSIGNSKLWIELLCQYGGNLLTVDWFSRVWILQEVVLCPELYFVWSDLIMSWDHMHALCEWLPDEFEDFKHERSRFPGKKTISVIADLRAMRHDVHRDCDLATAIWANAGQQATDPRDYVYGILGLVTSTPTISIHVDYTSKNTTQALFVDITGRWTQENQSFRLVYGAGRCITLESYGLPSWVPNYTDLTPTIHHVNETHAAGLKHVRSDLGISCTGDRLHLQAWMIDTISAVQIKPYNCPTESKDPEAVLASAVETFAAGRCPLPWSRERVIDFCEAVLGVYEKPLTESARVTNLNTLLALLPDNVFHDDVTRVQPAEADRRRMMLRLIWHMESFSLALTTQGHFVSVPHPLQAKEVAFWQREELSSEQIREYKKWAPRPGDVIAVPLGSHLPFLLRQYKNIFYSGPLWDDLYELLQTCYMPAMNDGNYANRMDIELQKIQIF